MSDKERIKSIREIQKKYKVPESLVSHCIAHQHEASTLEKFCKEFSETGHVECCNGCCWGDHPKEPQKEVVESKPRKKKQIKNGDV